MRNKVNGNMDNEPFVAILLCGNEGRTRVSVQVCGIETYEEFHPMKKEMSSDAIACVVICAECSKSEAVKITVGNAVSRLWIWLRWFSIANVDTSLYCDPHELVQMIDSAAADMTTEDKMRSQFPRVEEAILKEAPVVGKRKRRSLFDEEIAWERATKEKSSYFENKRFVARMDVHAELKQESAWLAESDAVIAKMMDLHVQTLDHLDETGIVDLLFKVLSSHFQFITVCVYFIVLWTHGTVLALVIPIAILSYGLLEYRRPNRYFWLWVVAFTQLAMFFKFLFQLNVFCVATPSVESTFYFYDLTPDPRCIEDSAKSKDVLRFDLVLGIYKWSNTVGLLIGDIICLICVAVHVMVLKRKGVWNESEHLHDGYVNKWYNEFIKRVHKLELFEELKKRGKYFATVENGDGLDYQKFEKLKIPLNFSDNCMYAFETKCRKFVPLSVRKWVFSVLTPEFRVELKQESILAHVKPGVDLYFWQFMVELVTIVYILLTYSAWAESSSADSGLSSSRLSGGMVGWLSLQMIFMVCDRIAYLNRSLLFKFVIQLCGVILFHYYVFVAWPRATALSFSDSPLLIIFYLLKLGYWILSAVQLRNGYPTFDRRHSRMAKEYGMFYYVFFMAYSALPFVFEMRTILEWVCIPTVLRFDELLKVEDIFGTLFLIKCDILSLKTQRKRGDLQPLFPLKCGQGGCVFLIILVILVVPLLLFSTASPATEHNTVISTQFQVKLVNIPNFGDLDICEFTNYQICGGSGQPSCANTETLPSKVKRTFEPSNQIWQLATFQRDSDSVWTAPYPIRTTVADILKNSTETELKNTNLQIYYEFTRMGPNDNNPIANTQNVVSGFNATTADEFAQVMLGSESNVSSFMAPNALQTWFSLPATGAMTEYKNDKAHMANLSFHSSDSEESGYWSVTIDSGKPVSFVLISDNFVSSGILQTLGVQSYSVVGLYVVVVYTFSQLLRTLYSDKMKDIMYLDLPNVDYLLRLVSAVKLARTQRNFFLEELLYRKLVRIYRDPSLMVKLTRRMANSNSTAAKDNLAFDGFTDTSKDNPNQMGFAMRHRGPQALQLAQAQMEEGQRLRRDTQTETE